MNISSYHTEELFDSQLLYSAVSSFLSEWQFADNYLNILLYLQWLFYKTNAMWEN